MDNCSKDDTYKYQFRSECYKECPKDISEESKKTPFLCEPKCPAENPYMSLINQQCIKKCDFQDILDKKFQRYDKKGRNK